MATVVEIALRAIDQASSAIDAVMGNATDAARTASDAYQKAGSQIDQASASAAAAVESVGDSAQVAGGEMSDSFGQAGDSAKGLGDTVKQWLSDPINQLGTGVTALGVGIRGLTSDTFDVSSAMDRAAIVTGMTNQQVRDLTFSNANAGLSTDEIASSVEELGRRGQFTAEELEATVNAVDLMTDALGGDMVANIDSADRAMAAFDIPLTQINEHLDTFTFLEKKTSVGVQEFGQYMSRVAPDIKAANLSMEDVAVALASIESSGIRGRPAITLMTQALTDAKGSGDAFWQAIGVSQGVIDQQRASLEATAGMTERLSAANEKNLGWYDTLKSKLDVAKVAMGDYLQPLDDVGQGLTALGPAILAANQAHTFFATGIGKSVIPMVKSMGASLISLATNPVTLVIAGVSLLVLGVVQLIKHWDDVKEAGIRAWEGIKPHIQPVIDLVQWVSDKVQAAIGWFGRLFGTTKGTLAQDVAEVTGSVDGLTDALVGHSLVPALDEWDLASVAAERSTRRLGDTAADFEGTMAVVTPAVDAATTAVQAFDGAAASAAASAAEVTNKIAGIKMPAAGEAAAAVTGEYLALQEASGRPVDVDTLRAIAGGDVPTEVKRARAEQLKDQGAPSWLWWEDLTALAGGGIATAPLIGLMGEAGDEAILPIERIVPIVAEGVREAGGREAESGPVYITVELDGRVIAKTVLPHMRRQIVLKTGVA